MFDTEGLVSFFEQILMRSLGEETEVEDYALVTGGNINTAVCLQTAGGNYFLKFREMDDADVFEKEAMGLQLLQSAIREDIISDFENDIGVFGVIGDGHLRIPHVYGYGHTQGYGYLLLQFVESQMPSRYYWRNLGAGLAKLHAHQGPSSGLRHHNYLGTLLQTNDQEESWPVFWARQRVIPMAGKALLDDLIPLELFKRIEQLCDLLPEVLPQEGRSLLHGDLWNGNIMPNKQGKPTIFDPSVYYGHREVDLAMTRLFGGFPTNFYEAYQEAAPLEPGWTERMEIYTLYPLLVHVNLFGAAYVAGVEKVLVRFGV
jgi:fructosamine-3-kinase